MCCNYRDIVRLLVRCPILFTVFTGAFLLMGCSGRGGMVQNDIPSCTVCCKHWWLSEAMVILREMKCFHRECVRRLRYPGGG